MVNDTVDNSLVPEELRVLVVDVAFGGHDIVDQSLVHELEDAEDDGQTLRVAERCADGG